jgi:hypothetical protein
MRTEQVPHPAGDIFYLQICGVEMMRNQRLVAEHSKWHE